MFLPSKLDGIAYQISYIFVRYFIINGPYGKDKARSITHLKSVTAVKIKIIDLLEILSQDNSQATTFL